MTRKFTTSSVRRGTAWALAITTRLQFVAKLHYNCYQFINSRAQHVSTTRACVWTGLSLRFLVELFYTSPHELQRVCMFKYRRLIAWLPARVKAKVLFAFCCLFDHLPRIWIIRLRHVIILCAFREFCSVQIRRNSCKLAETYFRVSIY